MAGLLSHGYAHSTAHTQTLQVGPIHIWRAHARRTCTNTGTQTRTHDAHSHTLAQDSGVGMLSYSDQTTPADDGDQPKSMGGDSVPRTPDQGTRMNSVCSRTHTRCGHHCSWMRSISVQSFTPETSESEFSSSCSRSRSNCMAIIVAWVCAQHGVYVHALLGPAHIITHARTHRYPNTHTRCTHTHARAGLWCQHHAQHR